MKIVTWNMAHRGEAWHYLLNSDVDIALLQEAASPPADVANQIEFDPAQWETAGAGVNRPWRAAIANLTKRNTLEWFHPKSIETAGAGELAVSRMGSLAAASLRMDSGEDLIIISAYGVWEIPHNSIGSSWIYADASVHRLISDLSVFVGNQKNHRIIVAGDFNILYGYGENGSPYWASRYQTVFDRMSVLGLDFMGPQHPDGRPVSPWPDELPRSSKNVPTFYHSRQDPATASRQLDFVFASRMLADRMSVKALNEPNHWGPSDHCQVEIEIN